MRLPLFRRSPSAARPPADPAVIRDADELVQVWGHAAYQRAADFSWREDTGLMSSPRPGHWWRVRREIGRRDGREEAEPMAEFAA